MVFWQVHNLGEIDIIILTDDEFVVFGSDLILECWTDTSTCLWEDFQPCWSDLLLQGASTIVAKPSLALWDERIQIALPSTHPPNLLTKPTLCTAFDKANSFTKAFILFFLDRCIDCFQVYKAMADLVFQDGMKTKATMTRRLYYKKVTPNLII